MNDVAHAAVERPRWHRAKDSADLYDALCLMERHECLPWNLDFNSSIHAERERLRRVIEKLSKCSSMRFRMLLHNWTIYLIRVE